MRIDLNTQSPNVQGSGKAGKSDSSSHSVASSVARDEARLRLDHARVQALEADVRNYPEVRREKVEPLQRAVQSGTYQVDASRTAEAVVSELQASPIGIR